MDISMDYREAALFVWETRDAWSSTARVISFLVRKLINDYDKNNDSNEAAT